MSADFMSKPKTRQRNHYKREKNTAKKRFIITLPIIAICIWLGIRFGASGWLTAIGLAGLATSIYTAFSNRQTRMPKAPAAAALFSISFIAYGIYCIHIGSERAAALEVWRTITAAALIFAAWAIYKLKKRLR